MIDYMALRLLLRGKLLTLVVCTTGSTSLSATATGFRRAVGSFITDGFVVGMEVTATGFAVAANNGAYVITAVTATDLTVKGGLAVDAVAGGRTLTVGLPSTRVWENRAYAPIAGKPYIEEDFVTDNPPTLLGLTSGGVIAGTPIYVLRWFGIADIGTAAIERSIQALLNLFPASQAFLMATGDVARVRGDIMPSRSRLTEPLAGYSLCTVTIPLRVYSNNVVTQTVIGAPGSFGGGAVFG